MKNIYLVNDNYVATAYGIGTQLREYIHCLKALNFNINLIELNSAQNDFTITEKNGIRKFIFPRSHDENDYKYPVNVVRLLRLHIEDDGDLIFNLHYSHLITLADELKKHFRGSKIVLTIHYLAWMWRINGDTDLFNRIISQKGVAKIQDKYKDVLKLYDDYRLIFNKSDALICLSKDTDNLLRGHYPDQANKLHLIRNGLRDKTKRLSRECKIREKFNFGPDEKIILFVGRLDKMKGIYPVLSCFQDILKAHPDARLIIVGAAGDFNQAIDKCKNSLSKVSFIGRLDQKELSGLYGIAEIGLLPSYSEECSYVAIEMMMHGLPIVSSDGRGLNGMFRDGINARIAHIDNPEKEEGFRKNLTEAISELLSSETLRTTMGKEARKCFKTMYEIRHMQKQYETFFEKLYCL